MDKTCESSANALSPRHMSDKPEKPSRKRLLSGTKRCFSVLLVIAIFTVISTAVSSHDVAHAKSSTIQSTPTAKSNGAGVKLPCASSSACGFPDEHTTGVPAGKKLIPYKGKMIIRQNNLTIDGADIHGALDIYANNVTISNSRLTSSDIWGVLLREQYGNLKIIHCTFIGQQSHGKGQYAIVNYGSGSLEVAFSNISSWQDAIDTNAGYVHDNYVHDVAYVPNAHTNAFMSEGGGSSAGLHVSHNTLLNFDEKGQSGALSLFPNDAPVKNALIENNWLAGGAFTFYGGERGNSKTSTNVRVLNNVFSTQHYKLSGYYGPVAYYNPKGHGNVFQGNVFSNGKPVSPL